MNRHVEVTEYPEVRFNGRYVRLCSCGASFWSSDMDAAHRCLDRHIAGHRHTQLMEAGAL